MQTRVVMLIGVVSLAGGWLAGSTSAPASPQVSGSERRGPKPLGTGEPVAPYTQQLRLKLQEQPRSPSPGRNPFAFGSRRIASPVARAAQTDMTEPVMAIGAPPAPLRARFELSGVASSHVDGVAILTAILSDGGTMVFAKAGDTLAGGYRVVSVADTAVVIADATGQEQSVRLRP